MGENEKQELGGCNPEDGIRRDLAVRREMEERQDFGERQNLAERHGIKKGQNLGEQKAHENPQKVIPANPKAKDTFFKKVYESEERQRDLASFLLGIAPERIRTANVRPILFGNRENDFACLCDGVVYMMMEAQSSPSPNIAYRMAEYAIAGLRSLVESERALYGGTRVMLPVPKLFVTQTGIEEKREHLPKDILTDMSLSDSYYSTRESYSKEIPPDIQVTVHAYDFRMTPDEIKTYIEKNAIPRRFDEHDGDLMDYALVANGMTYMQGALRRGRYEMPANVSTVAEFLQLEADRGIFVDLLTDKEVCDMAMAQFTRDDILIYQGLEKGREEGLEKGLEKGREEGFEKGREETRREDLEAFILDKVEDGVPEGKIIQKLVKYFPLDEDAARQYYAMFAK